MNDNPVGIECPRCGCRDLRVVRTVRKPGVIQRLRSCRHCGRRLVSYERIAGEPTASGRPHIWELKTKDEG